MKTCTKCNIEKEGNQFYKNIGSKDGLRTVCKECTKGYASSYYTNNKESLKISRTITKVRRWHLARVYGITLEEYNKMFETQNGKCLICNQPETQVNRKTNTLHSLSVDHDHATGKVRGLLCRRCNTLIGQVDDSVNILGRAIWYLKVKGEDTCTTHTLPIKDQKE